MKHSQLNHFFVLLAAVVVTFASSTLEAQGVPPSTAPSSGAPPTVVGVATAAPSGATPAAWSYQPLRWAINGGGGGPILSPELVPLYWGKNANNWLVGDGQPDDDPNLINSYLDNFANFISGVNELEGTEPVTKQYGVWGAERYGGTFTCKGSCSSGDSSIADVGIQQRIQSLQNSHVLPPSSPNRLFVVFLKGFTYQIPANWCGYHSLNGGTYYAVVPFERAARQPDGSTTDCSFQQLLSHELFESVTDPYPNNGWAYSGGEGGDECQPWSGAGASGIAAFPWGFTQTFADNVSGSCSAWSWPTSSTITASNWPRNGEVVNAFFTSPNLPGGLVHAYSPDGVSWAWEQAGPSVSPVALVQAPAIPVIDNPASDTSIHAFVRGSAGPTGSGTTGYLFHFSKTVGGSWSLSQLTDNTVGQPSAVQSTVATNIMDVVARGWDSSVVHYSSTDFINFFQEDLASQTLGPPIVNSNVHPGGGLSLDLYTYGMHADQVFNSGDTGSWSGFSTLESGINGMLPELIGAAEYAGQKIVFGALNGGYNASFEERQTYLPRYTIYNNGWTSTYYNFGSASPFGAFAVLSGINGVDVCWQDRSTFGYFHWHFNTPTHTWSQVTNTANWDPIQSLGGQYLNPPAMTYGTDGSIYVLGVGFDDNLYVTKINGNTVSGPTFTGLTGIL